MKLRVNKKAVIGIGTLIIFIAAILVAAISAGVIVYTQSRLQSEALTTGSDVRKSIGTSLIIDSVKVTNVENNRGSNFLLRMKLGPGSDSIKLNQTTISATISNASSTFLYGGVNESGFFTNKALRKIESKINNSKTRLFTDLDHDFKEDYIFISDSETLTISLSEKGEVNITIPNINLPGTFINNTFEINKDGNNYGEITIKGTTSNSNEIDKEMDIFIRPPETNIGNGVYTITYSMRSEQKSKDSLLFGDIVRVYFETRTTIGENQNFNLNVYTPKAVPTSKNLYSPDTMNSKMIDLFP